MKLSLEALPGHLSGALAPVYLISGDEPLRVSESLDALRARARQLGFSERDVHFVERGTDWSTIRGAAGTLSLFGDRRIIEIRMPTGKPGVSGGAALTALIDSVQDDVLLVIITDKLDQAAQKADWFRAAESRGAWLAVPDMPAARLGSWLRERCQRAGLVLDDAAVQLLAERVEGNLLAAHQEIEKLRLLLPPGRVPVDAVLAAVSDSTRFDVFALGDAVLSGDGARALRILDALQGEGVEPTLALWALTREMRSLWALRNGTPIYGRGAQMAAIERARPRAQKLSFARLIARAARADRMIKGRLQGDPWGEMMLFAADFCGYRTPAPPSGAH